MTDVQPQEEPTPEIEEPGVGVIVCVCGQEFAGDDPEARTHGESCPDVLALQQQATQPTTEQIQRNLLVAQMAALGLRPDGTAL